LDVILSESAMADESKNLRLLLLLYGPAIFLTWMMGTKRDPET
jgi:hypothetical protein